RRRGVGRHEELLHRLVVPDHLVRTQDALAAERLDEVADGPDVGGQGRPDQWGRGHRRGRHGVTLRRQPSRAPRACTGRTATPGARSRHPPRPGKPGILPDRLWMSPGREQENIPTHPTRHGKGVAKYRKAWCVWRMASTRLTAEARAQALAALEASVSPSAELDVLVIGGGVTGAGIALDAVTRGLSTAVVEAQDWAQGTSSRSSKLVHGGLRYLQMLDFELVH